jgi:hypothetical protein
VGSRTFEYIERLQRLQAEYGTALFARGFLLGRGTPSFTPDGWKTEQIGDYQILFDPRAALHRSQTGRTELLLVGDAFDLREPSRSNLDVARELSRAADRSPDDLYALVDYIHGRYAVVYKRGAEHIRVLTDATGMRAVFHTHDGAWSGSHASLVAINGGRSFQDRPRGRFGYPGRATAYDGVVLHVPNHELLVGTERVVRYYPRSPLNGLTPAEVADAVTPLLTRAVEGILARHPRPVMSLTAGLDSRTTLAVSRDLVQSIRFFTYFRSDGRDTDSADRFIAGELARMCGLKHEMLLVKDYLKSYPDSFSRLCSELTYYAHQPRLVYAYTQLFDPDDVHIRSNISEVGRCVYLRSKRVTTRLRTGRGLARTYLSYRPSRELSRREQASIIADFRDFAKVTRFARLGKLRDSRDMLYWEHRMGAWHSQVVLESDPAFQTFSIFNSRAILDLLMSAPEADRVGGRHLKAVIARAWPECLTLPINPRKIQAERGP